MAIAYSKLTAQGQISVPKEVRRRLGVGPGSVLEWEEEGERIVVRRAGRYSSEDVHRALFEEAPEPRPSKSSRKGCGSTSRAAMRAVDTNILVRLATRDNARQTEVAETFVSEGAWVPHVVLVEAMGVLESVYGLRPEKSPRLSRCSSSTGI